MQPGKEFPDFIRKVIRRSERLHLYGIYKVAAFPEAVTVDDVKAYALTVLETKLQVKFNSLTDSNKQDATTAMCFALKANLLDKIENKSHPTLNSTADKINACSRVTAVAYLGLVLACAGTALFTLYHVYKNPASLMNFSSLGSVVGNPLLQAACSVFAFRFIATTCATYADRIKEQSITAFYTELSQENIDKILMDGYEKFVCRSHNGLPAGASRS